MKHCRSYGTWISASLCFLTALCTAEYSELQAQNQRTKPTPQERRSALENLSPELDHILENWEKAGEFTKKLEGKHMRYIYEHVFAVEKWSEGEFYYESPDKGRIDLAPPENFEEGQQRMRNGKKYAIKADKAERWICDGEQIYAIDEARKEFQRLPIPKESQGANIVDGPLPFLFGISKEKVVMRYDLSIYRPEDGGRHDLENGIIHLKAKPLWQQDAANWEQAEVMLDARTYLPKAIRLIHPGGNAETVYVFKEVTRNAKQGIVQSLWKGDPFEPSLRGYKELTQTSRAEQDTKIR